MSDFPNDSELRNYLSMVLAHRAKGQGIAEFKLYDLYNEVGNAARAKGFLNQYIQKNVALRLAPFLMELIFQGIISPKPNNYELSWQEFEITDNGRVALIASSVSIYDPDGYIDHLKQQINGLDPGILQYVTESIACFRRNIHFACAVMIGAAAEKAIFLLFDSIIESKQDVNEQSKLRRLYDNPNLPKVFETIQKQLEPLTAKGGAMPYESHQGCSQHLLSLFEMIRVQRNESVHPIAISSNEVSVSKLILCLNSFPSALDVVYRLISWFKGNIGQL